jgi:hypothetical protein
MSLISDLVLDLGRPVVYEPVATVGDLNKFTDIVTGAVWSLVVSNGHFIVKQEVP